MRSLALESSWYEKILAEITSLSERERALKELKRTQEKLRRLGRAYIDGLIDEADYAVQCTSLQQVLGTLVIPEADTTLNAGTFWDNLETIWEEANLEEWHRISVNMFDAVYVDLVTKPIVGLVRAGDKVLLKEKIAALLETENPVSGVTNPPLRPEMQCLAVITREGGGALQPPKELEITVGWGHGGQNGVVMPGKGKLIERGYTPEEKQFITSGAEKLGIPPEKALDQLGEHTLDVYLNEVAFWKN